jgi:replicative DNA helicase
MKEDTLLGKLPPQSLEAERGVLGSLLMDPSSLPKALEILQPSDFYWDVHQIIYKAILALEGRAEPIDIVTVAEELRRGGNLDKVGGVEYLHLLLDSVPTSAYIEHYARIVQQKATLRSLISASQEIIGMAYSEQEEVDKILDKAEGLIFQVGQKRISKTFEPLKPVLEEEFERLDELYHKRKLTIGLPTGFRSLDLITAGFQKSNLIILAGRPGTGKTALALNFAEHIAVKLKIPVGIFSLEMSKAEIAQRMLCSYARVNLHCFRTGSLKPDDWGRVISAISDLSNAPIYIDDTPVQTTLEMRAKARRLMSEVDLGLLIIDYLQLIHYEGRAENRNQEISAIARSLKALAREFNIPVIALSQLSRRVEMREDKRPMLSDLRDSGSIEAEADVVMLLYRPSIYEKKEKKSTLELEGELEERGREEVEPVLIDVAKHRSGPTKVANLLFLPAYTRFEEMETRYSEEDYIPEEE